MVGADPGELRRLAVVLLRAAEEAGWLRRRMEAAAAQARLPTAGSRALGQLEDWMERGAADLRRRATHLEEGWSRDASGDPSLPVSVPGRCASVGVPVQARRGEPGGRDAPLGEPLFASAALQCGPALAWDDDAALRVVVGPGGLVRMARGKRKGGAGPPPPPAPTTDQRLDKARLPHGDDAEYAFVPDKTWHPTEPLHWDHDRRGYRDAKGNIWRKGRSITPGDPFEWDVQQKDGSHINVDLRGRISH
ncbi:MAG: polymorphic toxin type 17 domain-containing protein [Actinomycetota bacterium]